LKRIETTFAGRPLILETGRMAKQAHGACLIQYGETVALCTAVAQERPTRLPFFPLTVEYRERAYAAGRIPGGFFKREAMPGEGEVLTARLIDRPIRPLFPDGFMHETQIMVHVLSADQENAADVISLAGCSVALCMSRIPFERPVAAVRVGRIERHWVLNPTFQQLEYSDLDLVVAGTAEGILMVEGGAAAIAEADIVEALAVGHDGIRQLCQLQEEFLDGIRDAPMEWSAAEVPDALLDRVDQLVAGRIVEAMLMPDKAERGTFLRALREEIGLALAEEYPDGDDTVRSLLGEREKAALRERVLRDGIRADGRGPDDVRPITIETGLLARTHGSALFTRGQTQALAAVTLGTASDEQRIETIDSAQQTTRSFMLHYNFPPFSTGEAKPIRSTSRREKGHGALAARAIQPVLPAFDAFPYTVRVVSEVLESNGSSSMATVCAASLALMDAGVPVTDACAGVAMGLIKDGERVAVLTDILGLEDALGDMDFKVAGTREGVTSIQMDIKTEGLTVDLMTEALEKARRARLLILDRMAEGLAAPRAELSAWAPRIITVRINPSKIGDIIGPKGKNIRAIQEDTGTKISVEDDGTVTIASVSAANGERARERILGMTQEPEVGRIYEGPVRSTTAFGAFIEIMPGTDGLCHISELQEARTANTEDVVKKGDIVRVKLLSIDEKGRLRLSRKAALSEPPPGG
jgi:polyribonucleotide nucleotidyltransferase